LSPLSFPRSVVSPSNRFYILNGLPEREAQAGGRTRDDMLDGILAQAPASYAETRAQVQHIACPDPAAFHAAISRIQADAHAGARPLVFVHGHGDSEKGLQLASGAFIGWPAYLEALNAVTLAAAGELTVIAAFCQSMAIVPLLPSTAPLPFAFYYGYDHEVSAGTVEDETAALYQAFLKDGGQSVGSLPATLKSHSEYDHVAPALAQLCALWAAPAVVAQAVPALSKRSVRRHVEARLIANGERPQRVGETVKAAFRSEAVLEQVVAQFMHDTERRQQVIGGLLRWRDQRPPVSSPTASNTRSRVP